MSSPRILIVEDEVIVAMDLEHGLVDLGYQVVGIACTGEEAIAKAVDTHPDLILMDIRLTGEMDGIEAASQIRSRLDVPIIYLTAYADQNTLQRARVTEPFGYLAKPYQERDLHTTIEMALYKHQTDKKLKAYAAELETRNRELGLFTYAVANNLNSLARMITFHANSLKEIIGMTEEVARYLNAIARNGRKISQIIDDLLLLTRVQHTSIELQPLNMGRIVAQAQQRLQQVIEETETEIKFPAHWPEVLGYGPWIEEIWVSFITNGIEYGGCPPRLQIGATILSNQQVRFWLRDNGNGLTSDEKAYLLSSAANTDTNMQRLDDLKLRLSIAQHIVEKLGGRIDIDSDAASGRGIVFSFTLPGVANKFG